MRRKLLIILAICTVILVPAVSVCRFHSEVQRTLAETKNAEFALRLLANEYYANNHRIYDVTQPDGFAAGVTDEIRDLSGIEGTLTLGSWDTTRNAPRSLIYSNKKFVVIYEYEEQTGAHWKLYYQFQEWPAQKR